MKIPNLSEIPDLTVVPEGEYDLRIMSVKDKTSNKGRAGTQFVCKILDQENAQNLLHSIWYPAESDDADKKELMWRMVKEFLVSLGVDVTEEFDVEELKGTEFTALLKVDSYGGNERNEIVRIV